MSLFNVFDIASSALTAQSERLNVTASNIANADSAAGPDGKAYRARQVVFQAVPGQESNGTAKVKVAGIVEDNTPSRQVYDPKHPLADAQGYVTMPNVSVVDEMVNMLSASRSYQSNVEIMNTAKNLLLKTLTLGQ
ncbi:MAG TPA: flagellar basal body rod protein FlgC [Casimicrobiaceae bacterium]|nr:flagellar basal body rod protein FlgC [Casimicrobiaceae bacterium]